jgi:hypothetical protein
MLKADRQMERQWKFVRIKDAADEAEGCIDDQLKGCTGMSLSLQIFFDGSFFLDTQKFMT